MISVVIPTYQREKVLLDTLSSFFQLQPAEILVMDQTEQHDRNTQATLGEWNRIGRIRWIRLPKPSIPHAMNTGLILASNEIVLFADDDVIPDSNLLRAHLSSHQEGEHRVVAGQILQPGEEPTSIPHGQEFRFKSSESGHISELMGGNFSIRRELGLKVGGFDENFVRVAYRFEAEFAERILLAGEKIYFEPRASVRHLKAPAGGTRVYGSHLKSLGPAHSVGAYYYLFRSRFIKNRVLKVLMRPVREVRTRFHLRHPWWILPKLASEVAAMAWAALLVLRGPRLLNHECDSLA